MLLTSVETSRQRSSWGWTSGLAPVGAPPGAVQAVVLAPCSSCQAGAAPCLLWGVSLWPDFNHASLAHSLFSSQRRRVAFFLVLTHLGLPQPAQRPVAGDVRPGAGAPRCPFSCHAPCSQTLLAHGGLWTVEL